MWLSAEAVSQVWMCLDISDQSAELIASATAHCTSAEYVRPANSTLLTVLQCLLNLTVHDTFTSPENVCDDLHGIGTYG